MKNFNSFLSEQKELLEAGGFASTSGGGKWTSQGQGGMAGLGAQAPEQTMISHNSGMSPLFTDVHFYPGRVYNLGGLISQFAPLSQNMITPQEGVRLKAVFDEMPDGPAKQKLAELIDDTAHMTYSDEQEVSFNKVISELKKQIYSNQAPQVPYKQYTRYGDAFKPTPQRRF